MSLLGSLFGRRHLQRHLSPPPWVSARNVHLDLTWRFGPLSIVSCYVLSSKSSICADVYIYIYIYIYTYVVYIYAWEGLHGRIYIYIYIHSIYIYIYISGTTWFLATSLTEEQLAKGKSTAFDDRMVFFPGRSSGPRRIQLMLLLTPMEPNIDADWQGLSDRINTVAVKGWFGVLPCNFSMCLTWVQEQLWWN